MRQFLEELGVARALLLPKDFCAAGGVSVVPAATSSASRDGLAPSGAYRHLIGHATNLSWSPVPSLDPGSAPLDSGTAQDIAFSFSLDSGSFATVMLREMTKDCSVLFS